MANFLYDKGPTLQPFILSEAAGMRSRDEVTVKWDTDPIQSGTILVKGTPAGAEVCVPWTPTAGGTFAGILYERVLSKPAGGAATTKAVAITADAEVNVKYLANFADAQSAALVSLLASAGIKVRGLKSSLGIATPSQDAPNVETPV